MPKNVYADTTNHNKLTVILLAATLAIAGLVVAGVIDLKGFPGRTPEGALVDARINATREVEAKRAYEQAQAEQRMREEAAAEAAATAVKVAEQAQAERVGATNTAQAVGTITAAQATEGAGTAIANNNATSTAYPSTATARAVKDAQDAERVEREGQATVNAWATQGAIEILDVTATREAEDRAENREEAKVTQGWLTAVLIFLTFASSVACIVLMIRIWFIHIKPLIPLKKRLVRISSLVDTIPELCRRLQKLEERIEHAEDQE